MFRTAWRWQSVLLILLPLVCSGCSRLGGVPKSDPHEVAEGRELYEDNGCATCHGSEGHGDGPVAKAMAIAPRDFRNASAFVNGYGLLQIAGTIGNGLVVGNQTMPAYDHLTSDEKRLLAVYIMSLREDSKSSSAKGE